MAKDIDVDDLSIQLALAFNPVKVELDTETQEPVEPAVGVSEIEDADKSEKPNRKRRRVLTRRESWIYIKLCGCIIVIEKK